MSKATLNPQMFAMAVCGLVHSVIGTEPGEVETDFHRSRDILVIEGPIHRAFDENQMLSEGFDRARIEVHRLQWEAERDSRRSGYKMVVRTIREWLDDYDIIFSKTFVFYGDARSGGYSGTLGGYGGNERLVVRVGYPAPLHA